MELGPSAVAGQRDRARVGRHADDERHFTLPTAPSTRSSQGRLAERMAQARPLGPVGEPDDIACAVLYLA